MEERKGREGGYVVVIAVVTCRRKARRYPKSNQMSEWVSANQGRENGEKAAQRLLQSVVRKKRLCICAYIENKKKITESRAQKIRE